MLFFRRKGRYIVKIIDLTHTISEEMPVYPGTELPKLTNGSSYERDGFRETILNLYSHTGTHMDAPNHLFVGRTMLDEFPVSQFVGKALVIDCSHKKAGELITMDDLKSVWEKAEMAEFLLFYTGWSQLWGSEDYFGDYPCVDEQILRYLLESKKKGVGLDVIGLDPVLDPTLLRHRFLLENGEIVIIENLKNLDQMGSDLFQFMALPLKFEKSDGAPVRAIAYLEESESK
jgi:kynurenine formamidase